MELWKQIEQMVENGSSYVEIAKKLGLKSNMQAHAILNKHGNPKKSRKIYLEKLSKEIDDLVLLGKSASEVALILKVSERTVNRYKTKKSIYVETQISLLKTEIQTLADKGLSPMDIAIECNLMRNTIYRWKTRIKKEERAE